jgi:predicted nucleotidyltransferase
MENKSDLQVVLSDITKILEKLKITFHITGGLVSSLYGEPRFTQDIDIVVSLDPGNTLSSLLKEFQGSFYINDESIVKAVENQKMFQALHMETMIKIDFHVGEMIPGELSRSKILEILPEIFAPVVSIEDSILSKLSWIKNGSHKSRHDVIMMVKLNSDIDITYLNTQSIKMGTHDILEELKSEM